MKVWRSCAEVEAWSNQAGFVPTMGALHEGHLALMRQAKADCGACIASIFVNPTQFGPGEDFTRYPRDEEGDFAKARSAGVDAVFCPSAEEMYGDDLVRLRVTGVSDRWEGEFRPGHFDGVATVVCKLFNTVRPDRAYFGLKDFQQCAVIQATTRGLRMPVELRFVETIREADGLAMSSRNRYLNEEERITAPLLYATLLACALETRDGLALDKVLDSGTIDLERAGFRVQYLAAVDSTSMEPIESYREGARLIVAAYLGSTRLIDNCAL